jgi:hypothetical protein
MVTKEGRENNIRMIAERNIFVVTADEVDVVVSAQILPGIANTGIFYIDACESGLDFIFFTPVPDSLDIVSTTAADFADMNSSLSI